MNSASALLALSLLALLGLSVPGKVGQVRNDFTHDRDRTEAIVAAFLDMQGLRQGASHDLTLNGYYRLIEFRTPRCPAPIGVAVVKINAEAADMLDRLIGPGGTVRYVRDGRLHTTPPVLQSYVAEKARALLYDIARIGRPPTEAAVALVEPAPCPILSEMPWRDLPPLPNR